MGDGAGDGRFVVDGVGLEYRWTGPEPGRAATVVLLHEGLGSVGLWKDFPDRLAAATGLGVMAYSRRGYGASDPAELPRPLKYMHHEGLDVLPRILDAAGIRSAILVGHSDGASIALINAGGVGDPRVLGLVLMAPHVFNEELSVTSIRAAREAYEHGPLRGRLARYHRDVDNAFWGWNRAWLDPGFRSWNIEEYLPAIEIPSLLIQGEDDEYGTPAQVEAIREQVSGPVELLMLAGCRHSPHRDQPDATLEAVTRFAAHHAGATAKTAPGSAG